ncbi:MAG: hypothetical protein HY690_02920 [Chloroflexi bacterium]|nr:hypothetical protein [Chloroflexota bacterium]
MPFVAIIAFSPGGERPSAGTTRPKAFLGLSRQRYCSMPCGKRASYWRHADKRRAEKREQYHRRKGQPAGEVPPGQDGQGSA